MSVKSNGVLSLLVLALCVAPLVLAPVAAEAQAEETRLLRYPDIHGDRVVFSYAGDLWTAPSAGGTAIRVTAHPGVELFAKFSPDGNWIAFTGQYDGDEQVYVVSATGGVPKQLTYYPARGPLPQRWGFDNQVYGWTRDGSAVLFRSMRTGWDLTDTRLYTVSKDGGLPVPLAMPVSGAGDLSPDGTKVAYNPLVRDFRAWKRYAGGWAQDLYIFDLETFDALQITTDARTERDPMWIGDKVYFASDRDGHLNLFSYAVADGAIEQLTFSDPWDVRWPSADEDGQIVYELDGRLKVFDTRTGDDRALSISVPDDGLSMRPSHISVADDIEDFGLSPKGERALFVARGDVFTVPIENGPTRNLTRSSGAHDKAASWSPDGRKIAFISDRTGEEEIWLVNQDGSGEPEQLTDNGDAMRYSPRWSPDGKKIAFADKNGKLFALTVADKSIVEVADNPAGAVGDYTWSPKGGYLAFSLAEPSTFSSIWIWSASDGSLNEVTGIFNEFSPAWGMGGDYLYFMADRALAPQLGSFEWNYLVDRETYIYALALRKDVAHPFPPESDEVTIEKDEADSDEDGDEDAEDGDEDAENSDDDTDEDEGDATIKIDFDGLAQRVTRVPLPADNYGGLGTTEGHLLYFRGPTGYYGRGSDVQPALYKYSLEDRESEVLAEPIFGAAGTDDGSKVLVRGPGGFQLISVAGGKGSAKGVSTSGLAVDRVPKKE